MTMFSKTFHLIRSVLLCACVALFAGPERSNAADRPSKPVRIDTSLPIGADLMARTSLPSGADLMARMSADRLAQRSLQPVIVDNRPGTGGINTVTDLSERTITTEYLHSILMHMQFNELAPMAFTRFCLAFPDECKVKKTIFRAGAIKLTAERRAELTKVNTEVNRAIKYVLNTEGLAAEKWLIAPISGECHDYAITKRHELIARGWPAGTLLLAEVVVGWYSWDTHHLVLVVRTDAGDLVLDNATAEIRPWTETSYTWVRIQSPDNPLFWILAGRR